MAIYEAWDFKNQREASKAQTKLEELMGEFDNTKEEEQTMRKRPRTIGLKKSLEEKKEEEAALVQSYPLTHLLAQEIANDKESWLERANKHLEDKLEKANRDLSLQKKMTRHYKKLNQFS